MSKRKAIKRIIAVDDKGSSGNFFSVLHRRQALKNPPTRQDCQGSNRSIKPMPKNAVPKRMPRM